MVYFFIQNPNMFEQAESEIYLNKDELYRMASSMELYGGFIAGGAFCEIVRRAVSTKVRILHDSLFVGYLCLMGGQLCQIIGYIIMLMS